MNLRNQVSNVHHMLKYAIIENTEGTANQPRLKKVLSTLLSHPERAETIMLLR